MVRCGGPPSRRSRSPPRAWSAWTSGWRARTPSCTLAGSAGRPATRSTSSARSWPACMTATARSRCPAFTTAYRRAQIAAVSFSEAEYLRELGLPEPHGEAGYSTLERLWERPTLDVNGIRSGGKYTVIPHVAVGHVSCRLVPGQDPDAVIDAITRHVQRAPAAGLRVSVRPDLAREPAYTIAADHPAISAATVALEAVYPGQQV